MKKSILLFGFLISSLLGFSQSENVDKEDKLKFGFNFGLNWSNLFEGSPFSTSTDVTGGTNGFRIGLMADYLISENFSFSPKTEVSFNKSGFVTLNSDNSIESEYEMPINLELMGHLVYRIGNRKSKPYLLMGPNVKIPLSSGGDILDTSSDLAIDFGIGIGKSFSKFIFSPELRYSYGLLNISQDDAVPDLRFHNISLVFNFKK